MYIYLDIPILCRDLLELCVHVTRPEFMFFPSFIGVTLMVGFELIIGAFRLDPESPLH